jgi:CRISPR-associated protein Csd1
LQYIAKDFRNHGGEKKSYFESYFNQLNQWCISEYSDPKILAIKKYVEKGNVISDLINHQVLIADKDGKLLQKWEKAKDKQTPAIFEVMTGKQADAFIRWVVETPGVMESRVYWDKVLWDKWIQYYSSLKTGKALCYVTGTFTSPADQHPAKIRNDGDKAKLISSNDSSGFTYRGRFTSSDQTASVGFETTQKAHYALRWLISRQGYQKDDLTIVAWATSGAPIPKPTDDAFTMLGFEELLKDNPTQIDTAQDTAIRLKKRIAGYSQKLGDMTDVVVMGLDSATQGDCQSPTIVNYPF